MAAAHGAGRRPAAGAVRHRSRRQPAGGLLVSAMLLVLLIAGYGYIVLAEPGRSQRAVRLISVPADPGSTVPASSTSTHAGPPASGSTPARISIPAIGLDSPLQPLGRAVDGSLRPPTRPDQAGWYAAGVLPGDTGPAVIGGQLYAADGPAVFGRLRDVRLGDLVIVRRQDGTVLNFEVDGMQGYPAGQLPVSAVFGPAPAPELRLVSCPATDGQPAGYLQNLVVSARLG